MSHDQQRRVLPCVQTDEQLGDCFCGLRIEVAGRLVAEQQPRAADQRTGNCGALLLAARELGRPMVDAGLEADRAKQNVGPVARVWIRVSLPGSGPGRCRAP